MRPLVVIVTYRSAAVIDDCLRSVAASDVRPRIVVVDNASGDGSADIAAGHADVAVLRNEANRGFAAAVVQGVVAGDGDPIVLLNPDAELEPDCLRHLCAALADESVAIAGCKILDPDNATLQHAGGIVHANALTDHIGRGEPDDGRYDELRDVPYVTGAGLALRRAVWDRLGGLDPGYWPAYYEELELCWRARAAGYRVVVEPRAVMRHHEADSSRRQGAGKQELSSAYYRSYHRNRLRFVLRNFPASQFLGGFLPAEARWLLGGGPRGHRLALLGAYAASAARLPAIVWSRLLARSREAQRP